MKLKFHDVVNKTNAIKILKICATLCGAYVVMTQKNEIADSLISSTMSSDNTYYIPTYASAIDAIGKSNMWSADQRMAISSVLTKASSNYYSGIIAICKNRTLWSADKRIAIDNLTKKEKANE